MDSRSLTNETTDAPMGFHQFKRQADVATFPRVFSDYVRSFGDVYYWPQGNFHVVTRAALAQEALMDKNLSADRSSFFVSRMPNMDLGLIQDFFRVVSGMMVMSDGREHKKRRSIGAMGLTDELISGYKEQIPHHVGYLIRRHLRHGEIDFARDVTSKLPAIILADLFGIPESDRELFYQRSNEMTGFFGGGSGYENADGIRVNAAAKGLQEYFQDLIESRRLKPRRDFFGGMMAAAEKLGLSEEELISQAVMMLVAGQVTTADQMNNILYQLAAHPDVLTAVEADPSLRRPMIEELKRLDPAVTFLFRVAKEATNLGGYQIPQGGVVFISSHCINRDLHARPDDIDLHRRHFDHFSYGFGAHHCLGAKLAREEMASLFDYLLDHFKIMGFGQRQPQRDHYSLSFSGFKSLPLRLNPIH